MKFTNGKKVLAALLLVVTFLGTSIVNAETYTVASGDTLSEIALKFNTTVDDLVQLNQIKNRHLIMIGQVLEVSKEMTKNQNMAEEVMVEEPTSVEVTEPTNSVTPATPVIVEPTTPTTSVTSSSDASVTEAAAKEEIARRESGGSYTAQNGQFYGRYQLTITYLNGDLSPENQERVADAYVASRYGSWTAALAFHNANGWY